MSHGVRFAITYRGPVVAAWLVLTGAYTVLAALHSPAAVALIVVLFVATALWCFLVVTNVEDWWNDFRDQKRLVRLTGALLVGTLAGGVALGWWLTA